MTSRTNQQRQSDLLAGFDVVETVMKNIFYGFDIVEIAANLEPLEGFDIVEGSPKRQSKKQTENTDLLKGFDIVEGSPKRNVKSNNNNNNTLNLLAGFDLIIIII